MNELTANMKTEEAIKEKIKESRFESINGKDLMEMDLPPLHYTISTILPHGFFILAGGANVVRFSSNKDWGELQTKYFELMTLFCQFALRENGEEKLWYKKILELMPKDDSDGSSTDNELKDIP